MLAPRPTAIRRPTTTPACALFLHTRSKLPNLIGRRHVLFMLLFWQLTTFSPFRIAKPRPYTQLVANPVPPSLPIRLIQAAGETISPVNETCLAGTGESEPKFGDACDLVHTSLPGHAPDKDARPGVG